MFNFLIIVSLLFLSSLFIKKYNFLGLTLFIAVLLSDTDSGGIFNGITSIFSSYKLFARGLVVLLMMIAVYLIFKEKLNQKLMKYYVYPLLALSILIFIIRTLRDGSPFYAATEVIYLGFPFFFIWLIGIVYNPKGSSEIVLNRLLVIQSVVALVVILLKSNTALINGVSYYMLNEPGWRKFGDIILNSNLSFGNFNKAGLNVIKFAQFHNPNSLGMYSTMFIITGLLKLKISKYQDHWFSSLIKNNRQSLWFIIIGIVFWFNSLTRGPIFMVIVTYIVYILSTKIKLSPKIQTIKNLRIKVSLAIVGLVAVLIAISMGLFGQTMMVSIRERLKGFDFAFKAIASSPLIGVKQTASDAIPHIYPLKIATYFGLPAMILCMIPFVNLTVITIKLFVQNLKENNKQRSLKSLLYLSMLLGAIFTNGVIVYVLFWVVFTEIIKLNGFVEEGREQSWNWMDKYPVFEVIKEKIQQVIKTIRVKLGK